jgi:ubiquinone/menaquinone biosynthesis C-methylase UbiE
MQNELRDNGNMWSSFTKEEAHSFLQSEELGVKHPARLFVRDLIAKMSGKPTLLDVPCGSGTDYEVLKDVCVYHGMDKTQLLVDTVAERYGVKTIIGDIRKNDVQDNSFDVVLARAIFEHLPGLIDTEMAMNECVRIAKNDIIFAFYLPLTGQTQTNWNGVYYENRYGKEDILAMLNRIGLPFEYHHVNVEGTHFADSYDIFHLKKATIKEATKEATKEGAKEVKKRGRSKKV